MKKTNLNKSYDISPNIRSSVFTPPKIDERKHQQDGNPSWHKENNSAYYRVPSGLVVSFGCGPVYVHTI
jgi:hypothetical protein